MTRRQVGGQVGLAGALAITCVVSGFSAITAVVSGFSAMTSVVSGFSRTVDAQQLPQEPPRFRSSVEVTSLDVSVVDGTGKPIANLAPADFVVRIDGNARRVVTAEWVTLQPSGDAPPPVPVPPDGFSTNEGSTGGRLIVLAIDQPNIRFGGAQAIAKTANGFIDRLMPSDRVAVAGIGVGAPATVFTADRARIKQAISRMGGQKQPNLINGHSISLSEAVAIEGGDERVLQDVTARECADTGRDAFGCASEVHIDARTMGQNARHDSDQTVQALRDLFIGLRTIDAPKTLILISEGFVLNDTALITEIGGLAAASRTSLYALRLDNQSFDMTVTRAPVNLAGDRLVQGEGLEALTAAARGTLFTVTGSGQTLFDRIESEISGFYLLGVESDPKDRDGKPHPIRVEVARRGAIVRSRRQLLNAPADRRVARSPRQAVVAALGSPLLASALPLRVASFALQGPERDKVQILIHADIGADYSGSKVVSVGYVITDKNGRTVDTKAADTRLGPVMNGVPSSLQYTAGASVAPGEYTLKLAAADGDRVGTVEHTIKAVLPEASGLRTSELMAGGPTGVGEILQPTVGYQVTFGSVHGYVEAYGPKADAVTVEYEIATAPDAPALVNADVPARPAGEARAIFTKVLPVHALPPGQYVLRAIFSIDGASVKILTRGFEVAAPKVLMTSADGLSTSSVDAELFLPVDDNAMAGPFRRDEAMVPATLDAFRERLDPAVKAAFDEGVVWLASGDYPKAEASFKRAIDPDVDSTAALVYLAASFAAAGHDTEAAAAWQTALIGGSDFPQLYQWLTDALLRSRDLSEARAMLEEAIGKWPSDVRFTRPLALMYATFGRGREAVRTLERYLAENPADRAAAFLGVQWLYTVHAAGTVVDSRADDLKLARSWADAYTQASGPQSALVKQWVEFLEKEGR